MNTIKIKGLLEHILGLRDDAFLSGDPEWEAICEEAEDIANSPSVILLDQHDGAPPVTLDWFVETYQSDDKVNMEYDLVAVTILKKGETVTLVTSDRTITRVS